MKIELNGTKLMNGFATGIATIAAVGVIAIGTAIGEHVAEPVFSLVRKAFAIPENDD